MTDPRVCQPGPQRAPSSTAARRSRMPPRACVCPHGACPTAPPPHPVQPPAPTALFSVSMTLSFPECHTNGVVKGDVWKWRLPVGVVLRSLSGCFPVSLSLSLPVAHCGLTVRLSTALGVISLRGLTGSVELQKSQTPVGAAHRPAFPCQVPKVPSSTPEVFCVFTQVFNILFKKLKSSLQEYGSLCFLPLINVPLLSKSSTNQGALFFALQKSMTITRLRFFSGTKRLTLLFIKC